MSQIAITTSQNVNIFFNTASVGERMLAFTIDILIKIGYLLLVYLVVIKFLDLGTFVSNLDRMSKSVVLLLFTFPVYFDTLFWEITLNGQTLGKKIMKIKVVKIDGYQAHVSEYFMRWILRLVDIYSNSGVVGVTAMVVSKNGQRLGDMVSGTTVISLKNKVHISHTIIENLQEDYQPVFPQVIAFSDDDMRIIKDNFQKAIRHKDQQVLRKLAEKIQSVISVNDDLMGLTDRKFIETVIKDYNFYTGKVVA